MRQARRTGQTQPRQAAPLGCRPRRGRSLCLSGSPASRIGWLALRSTWRTSWARVLGGGRSSSCAPGIRSCRTSTAHEIDIGLNGYEYTAQRARRYRASIPYYIYELALRARGNDPSTASWSSLRQPPANGRRKRIGVLAGSAADRYVTAEFATTCDIARFEGVVETFLLVDSGQLDATVQDLPALEFYLGQLKRYPRAKGRRPACAARLLRRLCTSGRRLADSRKSTRQSAHSTNRERCAASTRNMACGTPHKNGFRRSGRLAAARRVPRGRCSRLRCGPRCPSSSARPA